MTGQFEKLHSMSFPNNQKYSLEQLVEDLLEIPDDNEYGFIIECDLEFAVEITEKTKNFPSCPCQTKADIYMNSVKQRNYEPTQKLV